MRSENYFVTKKVANRASNFSQTSHTRSGILQRCVNSHCTQKSFATPDSKGDLKTLDELHLKPRGPIPSGQFHSSVISANGNIDETYALAIDQLRLLRNWRSHSTRAEMDKKTFDRFVKLAKDAFKALLVNTDDIDAIVNATGSAHVEAQSYDMRFFFLPIL